MSYPKCPFCFNNLIWQSDFNLDETHPEMNEEGVSSIWDCNNCECLLEFIYVDDYIKPTAILPMFYNEEE